MSSTKVLVETEFVGTEQRPHQPQAIEDNGLPQIHSVGVRVGAAVVLAGALAAAWFLRSPGLVLYLIVPIVIGALPVVLQHGGTTAWLNGREVVWARQSAIAGGKTDWFSRLVARPVRACRALVWRSTKGIADEHVRAGLRVTLALSISLCALTIAAAVAWVILMAVILVAVLVLVLWIALKALSSGSGPTGDRQRDKRPLSEFLAQGTSAPVVGPRGTRLVNEGVFGDTPAGVRIDKDGRILKEGVLGDLPSGYRLDEEGRLMKEGLFGDTPAGSRLGADGRVLDEGAFGDSPSGVRVDEEGRILEEGVFGDAPTGQRLEKV